MTNSSYNKSRLFVFLLHDHPLQHDRESDESRTTITWKISNPTGRTNRVCMACGQADVRHLAAATLSCVLVSKSFSACRSRSWLAGSPKIRFTIRPRCTAGRLAIASVQRWTFL